MNRTNETLTIRQLLEQARRLLSSDSARIDTEVLLTHVLGEARTYLHAWPEKVLPTEKTEHFRRLLQQRIAGTPVAYLTGQREFWSLPLAVTTDTLIPRPETEILVERALELIPADKPSQIADLGTGSGAIALALAHERPLANITATDISPAALEIAKSNARCLGSNNIQFQCGDWCAALDDTAYDMIVSNPPYVAESDPHLSTGDVRFEPRAALASGPKGMDDLGIITHSALNHLKPGGYLLLEHGYDQRDPVTQLLLSLGYQDVINHVDTAGLNRVATGKKAD